MRKKRKRTGRRSNYVYKPIFRATPHYVSRFFIFECTYAGMLCIEDKEILKEPPFFNICYLRTFILKLNADGITD